MPHSYEQICFASCLVVVCKIGYFSGDVTKLIDDCQALKPTTFPAVPRLLNKLYATIKGGMDKAGGCKGWLI